MESNLVEKKSFKEALVQGKIVAKVAEPDLFGRMPSGWEDGLNSLSLWGKDVGNSWKSDSAIKNSSTRSDSVGDFVREFEGKEDLQEIKESI